MNAVHPPPAEPVGGQATLLLDDVVLRDRYDVVVVGSGIGGLTTAALLACRNLSVLVLEQHYLPGGACTILRRDGVTFDAAVGMMFGFGHSGFSPHRFVMSAIGEEIDVIEHPNLYRMTIGGRHLTFWRDFERFFEELVEMFPSARDELRALYDHLWDIHDNVLPREGIVVPPTEAPLPSPGDPDPQLDVERLVELLTTNTAQLVERFVTDPEVLAFFNMLTCTYAYTTAEETPAILSAAMFVDNHDGGVFYPSGGTQMLSNKLERSIERHGGRVVCGHLVEEILVEAGGARGVRLADGTVIEADRVVSNATVWNLYRRLLPRHAVDPARAEWAEGLVPTYGSVVLYLWVDAEAIPEGTPPILFLIEDMAEITGNDITVFLSSVGDLTLCPPGTHVLTVVQPSTLRWPRPTDPGYRSEDYERLKHGEAERLLDQVATELPDIRRHIRRMVVGTPSTIERFLLKEHGAVGGPKQMMGQELANRLHARGEIPGLYHCGDSTVMGVGISATTISGVGAANMVLRDLGEPEYAPREHEQECVRLVQPSTWTPVPSPQVPLDSEVAARLARECQLCEDAPCKAACPASIDIPGFLRRVEAGNLVGAVEVIRDTNPLSELCGVVCPSERLCEAVCTRGRDASGAAPVRIRELHGWVSREATIQGMADPELAPPTGARVAVMGAGPAGLTCAHYLARAGHAVDLFDASASPGGVLRQSIPAFRLDERVLERELTTILPATVRFHPGARLGETHHLEQLEAGWDAVFLAVGRPQGRRMEIPGIAGIASHDALSLLEAARGGTPVPLRGRVLVIGGGSVAADAALSAARAGAEVRIVCLEARGEMPALAREVRELEDHGIIIEHGWGPVAVTSPTTLELRRCLRVHDDDGRFAPVFDEETTTTRELHHLVVAIGQEIPAALVDHLGGAIDQRGLVRVDPRTLAVPGRDRTWAGGDAVTRTGTVVEAVAQGRRAAVAIDRHLRGR
jgi:NADPH-dependent glutamate synthase beta subunit-like oxidoreductase